MREYIALSSRIQEATGELRTLIERIERLRDKAIQTPDDDHWDGVALNLHGFYTAVEQIFEDIARTIDQNVPDGSQWHRDLLLQMSAELKEVRPAVIRRETRHCLDQFRGFRQVVRNVYSFTLFPTRMSEL
ncbi:MAG: hypothetical protein DHS20C20_21580 [Ardenticatenaceae bacterium]|nr:MAG: hypothetical protein DHS20C20_21580 [Ardenticatenaceae bacterium]